MLLKLCCQFIASFEGLKLEPYQNKNDRPTIGYGTTFYEDGTPVTIHDSRITNERAQQLLEHFVLKFLTRVQTLVTIDVNDDQLIALTSFEYNTGGLHGSTLLRLINANDLQGASGEFEKWDHVAGTVNQGLLFRREKERALFMNTYQLPKVLS